MKFAAATITQNRLIVRPVLSRPPVSRTTAWPTVGRDGQKVHDWFRSRSSLLDEDREQADDDREHAEAFGERREDDREAADLAGRVGVAADGAAADRPARMPMPMPGPMTPRAARPAPMCSIRAFLLLSRAAARGIRTVMGRDRRGASVRDRPVGLRPGPRARDRLFARSCPSPRDGSRWRRTMNMSVRTLKMRAWIDVEHQLEAMQQRPGRTPIVSAVMTPSATSPP